MTRSVNEIVILAPVVPCLVGGVGASVVYTRCPRPRRIIPAGPGTNASARAGWTFTESQVAQPQSELHRRGKPICLLETKPAFRILAPVMNFRFNIGKATEAGCLFLERGGGRMNVMKLAKLMYLLDRLSLDRRGVPVAGGD